MKLLDFFAAYSKCQDCQSLLKQPPCKVLCAYPEESRFAALRGFLEVRDRNDVAYCNITITRTGRAFHRQLKGDFR